MIVGNILYLKRFTPSAVAAICQYQALSVASSSDVVSSTSFTPTLRPVGLLLQQPWPPSTSSPKLWYKYTFHLQPPQLQKVPPLLPSCMYCCEPRLVSTTLPSSVSLWHCQLCHHCASAIATNTSNTIFLPLFTLLPTSLYLRITYISSILSSLYLLSPP